MNFDSAVICIRDRQYGPAADYMVYSILKEGIHNLNQQQRNNITTQVAIQIKRTRLELNNWYRGTLKPIEIAEKVYHAVYDDVVKKLKPGKSASSGTLLEIEDDD